MALGLDDVKIMGIGLYERAREDANCLSSA